LKVPTRPGTSSSAFAKGAGSGFAGKSASATRYTGCREPCPVGTGELERAVAAPAAELGRRVLGNGVTGRAGNRLLAVKRGRVLGIVAARRFGAVGLFAALDDGRFYGGGVAGV
jgi:hypothetical protein